MSVYRGPYASLDLTKGVWLDLERDELGNTRCWMTIEGKEIELTQKQYEVLMSQRGEAHKATTLVERERIIKLLEAKEHQAMQAGQGKPMPERMEYLAVEISIRQVIALIKGEQE